LAAQNGEDETILTTENAAPAGAVGGAAEGVEAPAPSEAGGGVAAPGANNADNGEAIPENAETVENRAEAEQEESDLEEGTLNENTPITSNTGKIRFSNYANGDKNFCITLGVLFPLARTFPHQDTDTKNINIGGTGSLSYTYFLTPLFFIGGEIQGSFTSTIGKNWLFMFPIGLKGGVQFVYKSFEFPLSLAVGMAPQSYTDQTIMGMYLKPSVSAFYRINSDWSFGMNTAYWLVSEWPKDHNYDAYGHFIELTLTARYHF